MSPIVISWIIFACVFGGALLGMLLRKLLPEHHLDADSKSVVNLGMALIGTMSALVLGLLIASAKSSFDAQRRRIHPDVRECHPARSHPGPLRSGDQGSA